VVIRAVPWGSSKTAACCWRSRSSIGRTEMTTTATTVGCVEVRCRRLGAACHSTLRAPRWKVSVQTSKSQVAGPSVRRKSTPRMKSKQLKSMPTHVMV
jgi:hypothetical protein